MWSLKLVLIIIIEVLQVAITKAQYLKLTDFVVDDVCVVPSVDNLGFVVPS